MERKLGKATRDAYGEVLVQIGKEDPRVVVLDADLSKSTKTAAFGAAYPDRFFNCGIQEANMVGVASGLAACGKIPFVSSFASFLICKGFDQMRMAIAFSELDVKLVASHGGISIGEDGASQMSIEDIALAVTLPGFRVIVPADEFSTRSLIREFIRNPGPVYMRTGRPKAPIVYNENTKFEIGKGIRLREGSDVSLLANGLLVFEALQAADELAKEGIKASVVDLHTVKPLDEEIIIEESRRTGHIVVCEEHQIWGGLGSAVARAVSQHAPCKMNFVAIQDTFAESGTPDELLEKYGLTSPSIVQAAREVLKS